MPSLMLNLRTIQGFETLDVLSQAYGEHIKQVRTASSAPAAHPTKQSNLTMAITNMVRGTPT
jgi:hypothetical protein